MRVITASGLGEARAAALRERTVRVTMEYPDDPLGGVQTFPREEVFEAGLFMIIRIVNVGGMGTFSNILPFAILDNAMGFYRAPAPTDETRFLLNLVDGCFLANRQLSWYAERYLYVLPWMDRWAPEPSAIPGYYTNDNRETLLGRFDDWEKHAAGTGGGIFAPALLDLETGETLRFAIAVTACRGVVMSRHFVP